MKYIFILTFCLLFNSYAFAQPNQNKPLSGVGVEEIFLAKDDGKGQAGDKAENFSPTDVPIYCIVQLDSMKSATVKMNLVAVNVKGVKPETKVITISYKTNGEQSRVSFKGAPDGKWIAGNYRFDIFIDGKPAGKKDFEIQTGIKNTSGDSPPAKSATISGIKKRLQ